MREVNGSEGMIPLFGSFFRLAFFRDKADENIIEVLKVIFIDNLIGNVV